MTSNPLKTMATPRSLQNTCANIQCRKSSNLCWRISTYQGKECVLCKGCSLRHDQGQFCLYCEQIYRQRDSDLFDGKRWIECTECFRWTHVDCEVSHGYPKAETTYESQENASDYRCKGCRAAERSHAHCPPERVEEKMRLVPESKRRSGVKRKRALPSSRGSKQAAVHDFPMIFLLAAEEAERQMRLKDSHTRNANVFNPRYLPRMQAVCPKLASNTALESKIESQLRCLKDPPQLRNLTPSPGQPSSAQGISNLKQLHKAPTQSTQAQIQTRKNRESKAQTYPTQTHIQAKQLFHIKKAKLAQAKLVRAKRQRRSGVVEFYQSLTVFLRNVNAPLTRYPTIGGQDVNLYTLYRQVIARGGYDRIATNDKCWREILQKMGRHEGTEANSCCLLRGFYQEYLYAFEQFVHFGKSLKEMQAQPFPTAEKVTPNILNRRTAGLSKNILF